jgi:hypothetical protein
MDGAEAVADGATPLFRRTGLSIIWRMALQAVWWWPLKFGS